MPTKQIPATVREALDDDPLDEQIGVRDKEPMADAQDPGTDGYGPPRVKKDYGAIPGR